MITKGDSEFHMDEKRLQKMIHLAMFEQGEGKEDIEISRYFLNDYIWVGFIKNFFLITIAYVLLLAILLMYNFEYLALIFANMNFAPIIVGTIIFYLILLGIYTAITYVTRRLRYEKAARHMRKYYSKLKAFEKYCKFEDINPDNDGDNEDNVE